MRYGLIGEKLGHSFSKEIHEQLADYTYDLIPLTREEFPQFMEKREFNAINVTIPYKKDVIPYLDELDKNAGAIGAVNTIVNKDGRLTGHNTDYSGFLYMIRHNQVEIEGRKVVVLGNGGAAKAILAVLRDLNAGEIIISKPRVSPDTITTEECYAKHGDAQVIVNTSPVGMFPNVDASPLDVSRFPRCEAVLDIIYNPLETRLLRQGRELSLKTVNGLEMLIAQAKYAVEFFLDCKIDENVIDDIYQRMCRERA
ncbi:shikimate dehydrogenase [Anaerolentibacter hominis]|uniref:shikimate dehydrogenase family protein n=1 Tax=Anaerolentibacter hominis TaxID=3079009 RepID=UPI0031B86F83